MPGSQGSLIWYELMTSDADAAEAFYEKVVGWTIDPMGGEHEDYRVIAMPDGAVGGLLPLTRDMQDHGARPAWLAYIHVDDVDASLAAIGAAGGRTIMPARDIPGIGRIALAADPQGARFYVMKPIPPEGGGASTAFSPQRVGHCAWNELRTSDPDAAIAFYRDQFGWEEAGAMPMGAMGAYKFLARDGERIGAAMGGATPEEPPSWLPYFRVADIEAAAAAVEAGGGQVLHGPQEVPGGDRIVICRDPQGAGIGFVAAR